MGGVWSVDGWTAQDAERLAKQRAHILDSSRGGGGGGSRSSNTSTGGSYSGSGSSSGSLDDTTSSCGSLGCVGGRRGSHGGAWGDTSSGEESCCCCCCMCPKSRVSAAGVKRPPETMVMPASAGGVGVLPPLQKARCWHSLLLKEDNARFLLLALVLLIYMILGALVFQAFEEEKELRERNDFNRDFVATLKKVKDDIEANNVTLTKVEDLLYIWGNMTDKGFVSGRKKWDFAGSFHFVYTVVSTIGYGAAAPTTRGGRMFCIFYGLIGCSSGILFFNLFLERIITLLPIMRARHERKQRKKAEANAMAKNQLNARRGSQDSMEDSNLDSWKPSVYWVMFYLSLASIVVAFLGSVMYMKVEQWSYDDSLYFSFVSFATIGFGDFVSAQQPDEFYGSGLYAYRFFNFAILVLGCCCIYSLFNVISITIKQFLNCIIKRMVCCCSRGHCTQTPRRNTVSPSRIQKHSIKRVGGAEYDSMYGSEAERKLSGEMVSMREYITSNKVSLAVMQKQLYETAQMGRSSSMSARPRTPSEERFTPGQVGPLAIASSKLLDSMS
ncbi:potassium channel subfamily K member 13-like [Macrobrachium rosenbergii]|uniref:potassium channel subfamily K member 13-like n=1 Tax=Macrobrachium rosenbergii TaxID=79674 RepID=UPI0034D43168